MQHEHWHKGVCNHSLSFLDISHPFTQWLLCMHCVQDSITSTFHCSIIHQQCCICSRLHRSLVAVGIRRRRMRWERARQMDRQREYLQLFPTNSQYFKHLAFQSRTLKQNKAPDFVTMLQTIESGSDTLDWWVR